jgi:hypothetical protein
LIKKFSEGRNQMDIDGRAAGKGMAVDLIREAFAALAADFAAVDHKAALEALGRIELTIADALAEFRLHTGQGTVPYDAAFDAMLEVVSTLIEEARHAVQATGKPVT